MLKIVICDDEQYVVDELSKLVKQIIPSSTSYEVFKSTSAIEIVKYSENKNIDILLIDIKMPDCNGFSAVQCITENSINLLVIFITNMSMYVYESLKYRPYRFIRKSHIDELEEALISALEVLKFKDEEFALRINSKCQINLKITEIVYFESHHNNVEVITINNTYTFRSTLKVIENELKNKNFIRIYSSILINVKYINKVNLRLSEVELYYNENIVHLPVSRNCQAKLLNRYKNYLR